MLTAAVARFKARELRDVGSEIAFGGTIRIFRIDVAATTAGNRPQLAAKAARIRDSWVSLRAFARMRGLVFTGFLGRVALGGCPPRAPTDPYVRN
jgi:hypothetical protein